MLICKKVHGVRVIDYTKTSFLIEAYKLGCSDIPRTEFREFQDAVKDKKDAVIISLLRKYMVSVEYYN